MEVLAKLRLIHDGGEDGETAAQRPHVVRQYLALPLGVQQIAPALGLLGWRHHVGIDHHGVAGDQAAHLPFFRRLPLGHVRGVGHIAIFLHLARAEEAGDGGLPVLDHIRHETSR